MTASRRAGRQQVCVPDAEGMPTCSTGPLGRLGWTLRQIAEILHLERRPR